ncbi:MAG TPA: DUF190 domain-containing protein [Candidatus Saccharimonadales bacterium]|nr:DUF190 domain-containing protein [Candidatus Saccharimonadales bacterium]
MKKETKATLLRIFMGESDKHNGRELYEFLVEYLRKNHFAGVTVLRGIVGFGQKSLIHTANILDLSTDLPIIVEVVDSDEKIEEFKNMIETLKIEASMLITEEKVNVIRYGKDR